MLTARQIADEFRQTRREMWEKANATAAVAMTEKLTRDDEAHIRRLVEQNGIGGDDVEKTVRHVADLIVGQAEALADDLPARGGD